jgi:peptidoglycan/LPS O-acetylase OafA/YrhL
MNSGFSIYLDVVRFSAAILVYLWHSNQRAITESILPASNYGHSSVIVFFVLSGFVIAYVTDMKEKLLSIYASSRIARVFSVAIPAIAFTIVLDAVGRNLYIELYANQYPFDKFVLRALSSLLMTNEVWLISITSFSNVPYWSICYEWWYYVGFALIAFLPLRFGLLFFGLLMFAIGPKLALLAPIWWLGVGLYKWKFFHSISRSIACFLFVFSILGIALFHSQDRHSQISAQLAQWVGDEVPKQLAFSKWFLIDYVLAILVFANFVGARKLLESNGNFLMPLQRPVRFVAGFTLTLYLLHQPLFLFWASVIRGNPKTISFWALVTLLTFGSVYIIGVFTEGKRANLKKWLEPRLKFLDKIVKRPIGV